MEMNQFMIKPSRVNTSITGPGITPATLQFYCAKDFQIK
jgi:hypothetical protein